MRMSVLDRRRHRGTWPVVPFDLIRATAILVRRDTASRRHLDVETGLPVGAEQVDRTR